MTEVRVPTESRGERLDAFVARVEAELSRSRVKALIEAGAIRVDGKVEKPSFLLRGGEALSIEPPAPVPVALVPESRVLSILYEDAELIAIDKPAGMVVHPGAGHRDGTLVHALLGHCSDLAGIGGELRPGIVHRLDRETSGCILVAKTERALASLQGQFRDRSIEKVYRAIVHGGVGEAGRFETLHGRHPVDRLRFTGKVARGRSAVTEWRRLEGGDAASLVEVRLLTGRTHQIRMHFSEAGHPLLADALYGGVRREKRLSSTDPIRRAAERLGRQALHALRCRFRHPLTGASITVEAPLPDDLREALALLGLSWS